MAEIVDVTPGLWKDISKTFSQLMQSDKKLAELIRKIGKGTATYEDAQAIAIRIGEHSGTALEKTLTLERLPDGKLYWNIAEGTIKKSAKRDYQLISEAAENIQSNLNKSAGIGMKAVVPKFDEERVNSLMNRIVSEDTIDTVSWALRDPITHLAQSVIDDFVHDNAEQQYRAGMAPQIVRTAESGACAWCQSLAGTYDYDDVRAKDSEVYYRHNNCRCTVTYVPRAGVYNLMRKSGNAFVR